MQCLVALQNFVNKTNFNLTPRKVHVQANHLIRGAIGPSLVVLDCSLIKICILNRRFTWK